MASIVSKKKNRYPPRRYPTLCSDVAIRTSMPACSSRSSSFLVSKGSVGWRATPLMALHGLRHGGACIEAPRQRRRILRGFQHADADVGTADKGGIADQRDVAESNVFRFDIVDRLQQVSIRAKHHFGKLRRKIARASLSKRCDVDLADQRRRNRFVPLPALVGHPAVAVRTI